jgi:hypothetical protein
VRDQIVLMWSEAPARYLSQDDCLARLDLKGAKDATRLATAAYQYLNTWGCINLGVMNEGDDQGYRPPPPEEETAAADAAAAAGDDKADDESEEEGDDADEAHYPPKGTRHDDVLLTWRAFAVLRAVNLEETSQKQVRRILEGKVGYELDADQKDVFKAAVEAFLAGEGPKEKPAFVAEREARKAAREARRAAKRAREEAAAQRVARRAIVIGAGPAGLAAAAHLTRHGIEVVVLEGRDRVGGRVWSYQQGGFSAPVDLGASLITGIEPDVGNDKRPDPSAIICEQLGIPLHQLQSGDDSCPLFDQVTGATLPRDRDRLMHIYYDVLLDRCAEMYAECVAREDQEERDRMDRMSLQEGIDALLANPEEKKK